MKDLLSKEYYYYKIHALSMKSSALPISVSPFSCAFTWISFTKIVLEHTKGECLPYYTNIKGYLCYQASDFFYLKKKYCLVLEISRFLGFGEIDRFQNLLRHHKHCYLMKVTFMLISFES